MTAVPFKRLDRRAVDLDRLNADSWERLAETEFFYGAARRGCGGYKEGP